MRFAENACDERRPEVTLSDKSRPTCEQLLVHLTHVCALHLSSLWDDDGGTLFASAIAVLVGVAAFAIGFAMLQLPQDEKPKKNKPPSITTGWSYFFTFDYPRQERDPRTQALTVTDSAPEEAQQGVENSVAEQA